MQVFYNAALGNEAQTGEGVRSGTIDMGFAGSVGFGSYIKEVRVPQLPYLYKDFDELDRVFQQIGRSSTSASARTASSFSVRCMRGRA